MTPKHIIRLMRYAPLSKSLKLGPEDHIDTEFAVELRKATLEGRMTAICLHVPNEGTRSNSAGAIARALGLIPGVGGYAFLHVCRSFALECKATDGKQTETQKDFEQWCLAQGVPYQVLRTVAEGLAYCHLYRVLS